MNKRVDTKTYNQLFPLHLQISFIILFASAFMGSLCYIIFSPFDSDRSLVGLWIPISITSSLFFIILLIVNKKIPFPLYFCFLLASIVSLWYTSWPNVKIDGFGLTCQLINNLILCFCISFIILYQCFNKLRANNYLIFLIPLSICFIAFFLITFWSITANDEAVNIIDIGFLTLTLISLFVISLLFGFKVFTQKNFNPLLLISGILVTIVFVILFVLYLQLMCIPQFHDENNSYYITKTQEISLIVCFSLFIISYLLFGIYQLVFKSRKINTK